MASTLYDDDTEQKSSKADSLFSDSEQDTQTNQADSEIDDDSKQQSTLDSDTLKAGEEEVDDDDEDDESRSINSLHDDEDYFVDKGSRTGSGKGIFRRRTAVVGGGAMGIITLFALAGLSLPGLKLMTITKNINSRFFGSGETVTEKWTDKIATNYVKKHLIPNITNGTCTSTKVDRNCVSVPEGSSLTNKLYRGWRDSNFENKLWENQGLAFEKRGNTVTMITKAGDIDLPGDFTTSNKTLGQVTGTNNIRRAYLDALNNESKFKKKYQRYKVGKFLERKYGIRRCVFACKVGDDFADWRGNKKLAFKAKLIERVITPRSEVLGLIIECFINGGCSDPDGKSEDGERKTKFERSVDQKLQAYAEKTTQKAAKEIFEEANKLLSDAATTKGGLTRVVIERLVGNVLGDASGKLAGKAIPVIGWIDFIANGVSSVKNADAGLKKWIYVAKAAAVVSTFTLYATQADEQRAGQADMELLGSVVDSLGSDNGASAEQAPIYEHYFSSKPRVTGFLDLFNNKAIAASVYTCNNGEPVKGLICPEDSMNGDSTLTDALDVVTNNPGFSILDTISGWWLGTAGAAIKELGELAATGFSWIPGYSNLTDLLAGAVSPMFEFLGNMLVPSIFPDNLDTISGAKNLTAMMAGGNVSGNDTMQYVMGGKKLSLPEQQAVLDEQLQLENERFAALPLKDKLFNTDESNSFITQVAMSMPLTSNPFTFAVRNPMISPSSIFASATSMFKTQKVSAQQVVQEDPFGIPQSGWAVDDPAYETDPDMYTEEYCTAFNKKWEDDAVADPITGADIHTYVNPCKAIETTVDSVLDNSSDANESVDTSTAQVGNFVAGVAPPIENTDQLPCPVSPTVQEGRVVDAIRNGKTVRIKLCIVHGYLINANMASNFDKMYNDLKAAGFTFKGNQGNFRSNATQAAMYAEDPSSRAPAGKSYHELGLAVDTACSNADGSMAFTTSMEGKSRGLVEFKRAITEHPCLNWLHINSRNYGLLLQCDGKGAGGGEIGASKGGCESWHISPTGG